MLNRYFWGATVGFWFAAHALFTHVQYNASIDTEHYMSWVRTWVLLGPWFLNWIWMTAGIFIVTRHNDLPTKSMTRRVCSHLVWASAMLLTYWIVATAMRGLLGGRPLDEYVASFVRVVSTSAQLDLFIYFAVLMLALGVRFYHQAVEERIELKRLNYSLTREQLKTLRSQLNPHFLFNSLNTIASLIRLKRDKDAVTALSELSLMLRKILENKNNNDIKLKDEIAFIKSYLALQKMRFVDKLDANVVVQPECLDVEIPNMLLHPLVENAVQHGSQLESNKNLLNLDISRSKSELRVKLTNKVAKDDRHEGFGIGLGNTRARLARLYDSFQFELRPIEDGMFETRLVIPIGEHDA